MTADEYRQAVERLGLSLSAAAELLGVDRQTIHRRKTGELTVTREAELAISHLACGRKRKD